MSDVISGLDAFEEPRGTKPTPPDIPTRFLPVQFWRDIFGKEVQSAATYSYLWMADQMGHVAIGILLQFVLAYLLLVGGGAVGITFVSDYAGWIAVVGITGIVGFWEFRAFSVSKAKAATTSGFFPLDQELLKKNALIATGYMVFGVIVGFGLYEGAPYGPILFVVMVVVSILCAPFWLRQKITWQKASMPYLSRLADIQFETTDPAKITELKAVSGKIQEMIDKGPIATGPNQIVLAGPVGSGRTPLAAGIGTEFCFKDHKVRYLPFNSLLEIADQRSDRPDGKFPPIGSWGPKNIFYWPWFEAEVLIIDDISPIIGAAMRDDDKAFKAILETGLAPIKDLLSNRVTVWVFGEDSDDLKLKIVQCHQGLVETYCRNIQEFCGSPDKPPMVLHLPHPQHVKE